jgi:hypothetical protein
VSLFRRPAVAAAAAAFALAPLAGLAAPVYGPALSSLSFHPMVHTAGPSPFFLGHGGVNANTTSTNWAGYAATGSTYTSVSTTFTQPAVSCSSGDQYSAFWVGLDGYSSDSVEQTGTEADCAGRTAEYSAWYELYPANPVTYSNTVKPGDSITETVTFSGTDTYAMTIKDSTEGWTKTTTKTSRGDARSSAEVIAEAPYDGGVLPLADFGKVTFDSSTVDGSSLSSFDPTGINMVSSSGAAEATTSGFSGDNFSITWNSK